MTSGTRVTVAFRQLSRSWRRRQVQQTYDQLQAPSRLLFRRCSTQGCCSTSATPSFPKGGSQHRTSARGRRWRVGSPLAATTGSWQPDMEAMSTPEGDDPHPVSRASAPLHHVLDAKGRLSGFRNPWSTEAKPPTMGELWRVWRVWDDKKGRVTPEQRRTLEAAACKPDWSLIERTDSLDAAVAATWIGHATFILQFRNQCLEKDRASLADGAGCSSAAGATSTITTVYLDPVFSDRASPVSFLGPKRLVKAAPLEECPLPELVCISHNHYDHCDVGTIRALVARARSQNRSITWLVPLGLGPLLRDQNRIWGGWIPSSHPVHELDWFEQRTIGTLEVALVPAQHATGRSPWDRDRTLWGGWVLRHMDTNVRCYFAGDTAYRVIDESNEGYPYPTEAERQQLAEQYPKRKPCPAFRAIGDKWGPFDLAMIPIGAYSPRWFMSRFHVDPVDSVAIHRDVRARLSVAMHHSTFVLTDEGLGDPERRLSDACAAAGLSESDFVVWRHGETRLVAHKPAE